MPDEQRLSRRNWRILTAATREERLSRGALAVLAHLLDSQSPDAKAIAVRQDDLVKVAGLSRANVSRALARLVECGFLQVVTKGDKARPAHYKATMPGQPEIDPVEVTPSQPVDAQGVVEVTAANLTGATVTLSLAWRSGDLAGTTEVATFNTQDHDERAALIALVDASGIDTLDDPVQLVGKTVRVEGANFAPFSVL